MGCSGQLHREDCRANALGVPSPSRPSRQAPDRFICPALGLEKRGAFDRSVLKVNLNGVSPRGWSFHGDHTCRTRSPTLGMCRSLMSDTQSRPSTHTPLPTRAFWASVLLGISAGCPGPLALKPPGHVLSPRANSSLRREGQPTEILRPLPACPVPRAFSAVPGVGGPTSGYSLSPVGHHVSLMDIASQFSLLCVVNFSFLPDHPHRRTMLSLLHF